MFSWGDKRIICIYNACRCLESMLASLMAWFLVISLGQKSAMYVDQSWEIWMVVLLKTRLLGAKLVLMLGLLSGDLVSRIDGFNVIPSLQIVFGPDGSHVKSSTFAGNPQDTL